MTLEIDDLTVAFGDVLAVDRVTLRVEAGSIYALVGPSGCGKSTLLRAIAGLVTPSGGCVRWNDVDITATPTERRGVGFMFQDHALFTHRDVAENVGFGLRMRGVTGSYRDARVDELLELVGLGGFGDRSVERLSGGEAQRVALARALAPTPGLLLLDEPLASLDRALRNELNDELARLLGELGQTAVYVTHDQHEAFAIADRVGVMRRGKIVRDGTPAEVWEEPRSEFVARFVGHDTIIDYEGDRVAVRADAVSLVESSQDPSGRSGAVVECRFQGDRHRIVVMVEGEPWYVWHHGSLEPGTPVSVVIDERRLARLDR